MIGGPVGTSDDIASKSGFFVSLFEYNAELKRFLQDATVEIWIRIHLNPKDEFSTFVRENTGIGC
jgi:hypothetical protein